MSLPPLTDKGLLITDMIRPKVHLTGSLAGTDTTGTMRDLKEHLNLKVVKMYSKEKDAREEQKK